MEKQKSGEKLDFYAEGNNKDCVRVDNNGNGLQRLWQQNLTSFPLSRLETSEAIMDKYNTPVELMEVRDQSYRMRFF